MRQSLITLTVAGAAASLGLLWPSALDAQPPGGRGQGPGRGGPPSARPLPAMFERWDANEDGKLTQDEVPEMAWNRLSQADTDGDGMVTRDELAAMMQQRGGGPGRASTPPAAREDARRERPQREEARKERPQRDEARPQAPRPQRPDAQRRPPSGNRVDAWFNRLDKDGDGQLSKDEFAPVVARLEALAQQGRQGTGAGYRGGAGYGRGPGGPAWGGQPWGGPPPGRGAAHGWGQPPRWPGYGPYSWWGYGGRGFGPPPMGPRAPQSFRSP